MNPRPSLILVDDEERILRSLGMLFRTRYDIRMTTDAREALRWVDERPPDVIVSDQRMPLMTGATLLRQARLRAPNTMRVLLTGYSELDAVVSSVNEGEIFRFVQKPWDAQDLRDTVAQAADIARALRTAPAAAATPVNAAAAPAGPAVLVVEDDAAVVQGVREILPDITVHWARSIDEALPLIDAYPIGVIVSELSVGGSNVGAFLKLLKREHPDIVSIVLTPFQDVSVFIGLINQGQVYRLLPKPVRRGPLGMSLTSALRHHQALRDAPALRQAHAVEPIRDSAEASVAQRVMGMLTRLRGRTVPVAR